MDSGWVSACPPGEFEDHAALVVGLTDLLEHCPQAAVDLVDALADRIPLIAIVRGEEQRRQAIVLLTDWGVPAHRLHFVFMPVGSWMRDFAPSFVRWSDGRVWALDPQYPFASDNPTHDVVPAALASLLRVPRRPVPLALEGGNLLSNGWDLCVCTSALLDVNRHVGHEYGPGDLRSVLDQYYGFFRTVLLEPLLGHRTLHADMFVTFVRPDVVVVGACDARDDAAGAAVLDRNAAALKDATTRSRPLQVERIPMPPYRDGVCRTYTNVIYANGRLLVPHYPAVDPALERRAMETYERLLPGWELVQVNCRDVIRYGGGLRCLSSHVPWLHDRFDPVDSPARQRGVTVLS
jgi:agmatine deiminase